MSDEIFAWGASSNNQAMLAGRISLTFNAISIVRAAEGLNQDLAARLELLPIPRGPQGRLGLEGIVAAYVIWRFARNKKMAEKFLADLEIKYIGAFENSRFFFPSWPQTLLDAAIRSFVSGGLSCKPTHNPYAWPHPVALSGTRVRAPGGCAGCGARGGGLSRGAIGRRIGRCRFA